MDAPQTTNTQPGAALSPDLADFIIELSIALHKHAMYPGGHPSLEAAEGRVMQRLDALLRERRSVALGVAREQLIIEGLATDPKNPLLRALAQRLHDHGLGAVKFLAGVRREETADVLRNLARDPERDGLPLGADDGAPRWAHIRLFSMSFDQLHLLEDSDDPSVAPRASHRMDQLWLELAQAALQSELTEEDSDTDPVVVAEAINVHEREQAYDQVIVGYLLKLANELATADRAESAMVQQRISKLIGALDPEQLRRLLEMGGDLAQRRRFVIDAAQGMGVDAVLVLVQAAADRSRQAISGSLLRLFTKLAAHAESGADAVRSEADHALREHVQELVTDWKLPDPNPDEYSDVLDHVAGSTQRFLNSEASTLECEPERIVQISLETGSVGVEVFGAVDAMLERQRLARIVDLLEHAPEGSAAVDGLWQRVATPDRVRWILESQQQDLECLEPLVRILGLQVADPLFDALASPSRTVRRKALDVVAQLGPGIGPLAAGRLRGAPWYLERNLLMVIDRLPAWPADFSPLPYASHVDARVRREGIRLLLKHPGERDRAVCTALRDTDDQVVRTALGAALEKCPPAAIPLVIERLTKRQLNSDLELLAIRVVAASRHPAALEYLLDRAAASGKSWLLRRPLAAKSPQLVAVLAALVAHWPAEPRAAQLLARARDHKDAEIRAAVAAWRAAS